MKIQTILFSLLSAVSLSACVSSKPSESDVRKEIERLYAQQLGSCKRISVENFKRLNGMPDGENAYIVSMSYTLKVNPPSENEGLLKGYLEKRIELERTNDELSKQNSIFHGQLRDLQDKNTFSIMDVPENYRSGDNLAECQEESCKKFMHLRSEFARIKKEQDEVNKKMVNVGKLDNEMQEKLVKNFGDNCQKQVNIMLDKYATRYIDNEKTGGILAFGFKVDFSEQTRMVKTDNGWVIPGR